MIEWLDVSLLRINRGVSEDGHTYIHATFEGVFHEVWGSYLNRYLTKTRCENGGIARNALEGGDTFSFGEFTKHITFSEPVDSWLELPASEVVRILTNRVMQVRAWVEGLIWSEVIDFSAYASKGLATIEEITKSKRRLRI